MTDERIARLFMLRPFILAALPALIQKHTPAAGQEDGHVATLSSEQIAEVACTACEIAAAVIDVINAEPEPAESAT